jgi:hypothetical protein
MPRQTEQPPHPQEKQVLHPSWNASTPSQNGQIPLFIFSCSKSTADFGETGPQAFISSDMLIALHIWAQTDYKEFFSPLKIMNIKIIFCN